MSEKFPQRPQLNVEHPFEADDRLHVRHDLSSQQSMQRRMRDSRFPSNAAKGAIPDRQAQPPSEVLTEPVQFGVIERSHTTAHPVPAQSRSSVLDAERSRAIAYLNARGPAKAPGTWAPRRATAPCSFCFHPFPTSDVLT